jgi:hypothetical protein
VKVVSKLSEIINNLIKHLRTSSVYKTAKSMKVLRIVKDKYDKAQYKKKQDSVHIYGLKTLQIMKEGFEEIGHDFWLDYGTLLGAVREKDFISHDKDLDIGAFDFNDKTKEKLAQILESKGMKRYKQYIMDGKIIEEAYHYNGLHIDIFYYIEGEEDKIWCYFCEIGPNMEFENTSKYQIAKGYITKTATARFQGLTNYDFKGDTFKVPVNYHEYLIDNYGHSYMQKIKEWQSGSSPENIALVDTDTVIVKEYI